MSSVCRFFFFSVWKLFNVKIRDEKNEKKKNIEERKFHLSLQYATDSCKYPWYVEHSYITALFADENYNVKCMHETVDRC